MKKNRNLHRNTGQGSQIPEIYTGKQDRTFYTGRTGRQVRNLILTKGEKQDFFTVKKLKLMKFLSFPRKNDHYLVLCLLLIQSGRIDYSYLPLLENESLYFVVRPCVNNSGPV